MLPTGKPGLSRGKSDARKPTRRTPKQRRLSLELKDGRNHGMAQEPDLTLNNDLANLRINSGENEKEELGSVITFDESLPTDLEQQRHGPDSFIDKDIKILKRKVSVLKTIFPHTNASPSTHEKV